MNETELRYIINSIFGNPCFGSKTGYLNAFPRHTVLFNSSLGFEESDGIIRVVWLGDIDLSLPDTEPKLAVLHHKSESRNIYLYRESTINNQVFNGRPFPYFEWFAKYGRIPGSDKCRLQFKEIE